MKIALDYDETFTKDPKFWRKFIDQCHLADHEVMIVTFRDPSIPIEAELPIDVYYTSYRAKRDHMTNIGINIDVWIDDSPDCVVGHSQWTDEERERWKKDNGYAV